MSTYKVVRKTVKVGSYTADLFLVDSDNLVQVEEVVRTATELVVGLPTELFCSLVLVKGSASLSVALVLACGALKGYLTVGVYNLELDAYVIVSDYALGYIIPADSIH